jgi:hypothetical protein
MVFRNEFELGPFNPSDEIFTPIHLVRERMHSHMTRLTLQEIEKHRAWLSDWRVPLEMEDYVGRVNDYMGSEDFFSQPGVTFLRDAWSAAKFSECRKADAVRLIKAEWPDFEARIEGVVRQYECVEADLPGRRRGDEYRDSDPPRMKLDPVEDWIKRAEQIPAALKNAIEKKIRKRYSGRASLLIYLNIGEFGVRQKEIEASFLEMAAPATTHFESVWILWKDRVYGPWKRDQ